MNKQYEELIKQVLQEDQEAKFGDGNGNVALGGRTAVWNGASPARPIICGNPFGKTITIRNHDPMSDDRCYLVSFAAGAGSADVGHYVYSFDITMVPNK